MGIIPESEKSYPKGSGYIKAVFLNPVSNLNVEENTQINELN